MKNLLWQRPLVPYPVFNGVLVNVSQLALKKKKKKALICGVCQFLWYKDTHCGQFQPTNMFKNQLVKKTWKFNHWLSQASKSHLGHITELILPFFITSRNFILLHQFSKIKIKKWYFSAILQTEEATWQYLLVINK